MRLINTKTLRLEHFFEPEIPDYAILSHTWGSNEITLQEMSSKLVRLRRGFDKIRRTCSVARQSGLKYCWVDTCCIDKTSSAELSESINSMFHWYRKAAICYVLLSDLEPGGTIDDNLGNCRWFTRGWTLQELLAPSTLVFYDKSWTSRGGICHDGVVTSKFLPSPADVGFYTNDLSKQVCSITGIPQTVLGDQNAILLMPAAQVMSWASARRTTRIEDMAYSLLGMFDVNIPLLYGEGMKAFIRIQEEILRRSGDLSLLAWQSATPNNEYCGVLARNPADFSWCRELRLLRTGHPSPDVNLTNRGLRIQTTLHAHRPNSKDQIEKNSRPYFQYFLDLKLIAFSPDDSVESRVDTSFQSSVLRANYPAQLQETNLIGIRLLKCGPSLFCRDSQSKQELMVEDDDTSLILGYRSQPIHLAATSSFEGIAREHPRMDHVLGTLQLRHPVRDRNERPDQIREGYDICRQSELYFPGQEKVNLSRVANGSLWDQSRRSFILSKSNHTGWDALVFHLEEPETPDVYGSEGAVIFVFFLENYFQFLILCSEDDDGVEDALDNASNTDVYELLTSWPKLREKMELAMHEAEKREQVREQVEIDTLKRLSHNATQTLQSRSTWDQHRKGMEAIWLRPWSGDALKTKLRNQKWEISAQVIPKPIPRLGDLGWRDVTPCVELTWTAVSDTA